MKRQLITFAIVLVFMGLHTSLAVTSGGRLIVPVVVSVIGAAIIIALCADRIIGLAINMAPLCAALGVMTIATALGGEGLQQHLVSTGNLISSLLMAYATFIGLEYIGRERSSAIFLWLACALILGASLELYGGLRPISDAFRNATLTWRGVYGGAMGDFRDEAYYGGVRPKVFSPEPAELGFSMGTWILLWFVSGPVFGMRRLMGALGLAALGFFLVRSPTVIVCALLVCAFWFSEAGAWANRAKWLRGVIGVAALVAVIGIPPLVAVFTQYGRTGSFFIRELAPPVVAFNVLQAHPLFGSGLGGYGGQFQAAYSAASTSGSFARYPDLFGAFLATSGQGSRQIVNNQLWEYWISFGLLGGGAILYLTWRLMRKLRIPNRIFLVCLAPVLMILRGGISAPWGWITLFALGVLYREHVTVTMLDREREHAADDGGVLCAICESKAL